MSGYMTARQLGEGLRRFLGTVEAAASSSNIQVRFHGTALAEVSLLLHKLKDQLLYESRFAADFPAEFAGRTENGLELLLRVLGVLQRQLHEAQLSQASRFTTLLSRNSTNKRRKAGIAEADCLESLKLLLSAVRWGWGVVLEQVGHVELLLISLTSPQLDSKCYALELLTALLDEDGGWALALKGLTSLAGKNHDDSRLTILVSQLRHGLSTSKLHIQVLVTQFLNKMAALAPSLNHRVLVQIEAENAGFSPDALQQYGGSGDSDSLARELDVWRASYLALSGLPRQDSASSRRSTLLNGDLPYYPGTSSEHRRNDSLDDSSLRTRRMYEGRGLKAPIQRVKKRRDSDQSGAGVRRRAEEELVSGMLHPSQDLDPAAFPAPRFPIPRARSNRALDVEPPPEPRRRRRGGSFSGGDAAFPGLGQRSGSVPSFHAAELAGPRATNLVRTRSQGPIDANYRDIVSPLSPDPASQSARRKAEPVFGGGMKRAQSENALFFNDHYGKLPGQIRNEPQGRRVPIRSATLERGTEGESSGTDGGGETRAGLYRPSKGARHARHVAKNRSQSLHDLHRLDQGELAARTWESPTPHGSRYGLNEPPPPRREPPPPSRLRSSTPGPKPSNSSFLDRTPVPPPVPAFPAQGSLPRRAEPAPVPVTRRSHLPQRPVSPNPPPAPAERLLIPQRAAPPPPPPAATLVRRSKSDVHEARQKSAAAAAAASAGPVSPSVKMAGFSYLYPHSPTLDAIPLRTKETPPPEFPRQHLGSGLGTLPPPPPSAYSASPTPALRRHNEAIPANRNQPYQPPYPGRAPPPLHRPSPPLPPPPAEEIGDNHVIYIPVRFEGSDQLVQRPAKSIMKTASQASTAQGSGQSRQDPSNPNNYSYEREWTDPSGAHHQSSYSVTTSSNRPNERPTDRPNNDVQRRSGGSSYGGTRRRSAGGDEEVEDVLRNFDYLNEYDGTSSRGSRYGAY